MPLRRFVNDGLARPHAEGLAAFDRPGSLTQRAVDGLLASLAKA